VDHDWTPDGEWIVYLSYGEQPGQTAIYKMPAEGGEAIRLRDANASQPKVSPDGTRLLHQAYYEEERKEKTDIISLETGEVLWSQYIEGAQEHGWSPDGTAIVYSKHTEGVDNLWRQPLDAGEPEMITDFTERDGITSFRFSPDGKQIAFSKGLTTSDIVLLKNFR
jgi:Tol biopolymer transport system component